jgi:hypothetical protein
MPGDEGQGAGRKERDPERHPERDPGRHPERDPGRHPERRQQAPVFAVAPVRARHALSRVALFGVVIGVLAFVAGIAVASTGPTERALPPVERSSAPAVTAVSPSPAPVTAPPVSPSPAGPAAGSSRFSRGFQPAGMIAGLPDGAECIASDARDKEVPRTRRDGPRLTFQRSWMIWCPVPEERRQPFMLAVLEGLVKDVPADTYGYAAGTDGSGDALFPYAEAPLAGTVALTADAAGDGFAIAIVLEEWRSD